MAKRPLAVLTALILTLLIPTPTHASGVLDDGFEYWTIQDMIEYSSEIDAERIALCGTDASCRENFFRNRREDPEIGVKFRHLVDTFNANRIWLTSFNPTTGEAKFLYHGASGWDLMMGNDVEHGNLEELYFVWLEDSAITGFNNGSWFDPEHDHYVPYFIDEIKSGELSSDTHEIFSYIIDRDGDAMYPEQTEISFRFSNNANLEQNYTQQFFVGSMVGGVRTYDNRDYSSCVNSPYYREGMECRFIFTEDYSDRYVPYTANGEMATAANTPPLEITSNNTDTGATDVNNGFIVDADDDLNVDLYNTPDDTAGITTPTVSVSEAVTAPNTGQNTDTNENKAIELPWWLVGIVVMSIGIIVWFFWPNRKNREPIKKRKKI